MPARTFGYSCGFNRAHGLRRLFGVGGASIIGIAVGGPAFAARGPSRRRGTPQSPSSPRAGSSAASAPSSTTQEGGWGREYAWRIQGRMNATMASRLGHDPARGRSRAARWRRPSDSGRRSSSGGSASSSPCCRSSSPRSAACATSRARRGRVPAARGRNDRPRWLPSRHARAARDGGVAARADAPSSAFPIEQAGPAHIATLKTFDPPLAALEGRRFAAPSGAASGSSSRPTTASSCCSST